MAFSVYEGPSMLDGGPIIALLTGLERASTNVKTGPMLQLWILRSDMSPIEAVKNGEDQSICGSCKLRGDGSGKSRSCYVTIHQAPNQVFKKANSAKPLDYRLIQGQHIRLGAYGDPAALPISVLARLVSSSVHSTGYTHQWRTCDREYRQFLMASCDSVEERELAKSMGWRTFRIRPDDQKLPGEIVCPASTEAGALTQCRWCGKCNGMANPNGRDITITVHGIGKRHFLTKEATA